MYIYLCAYKYIAYTIAAGGIIDSSGWYAVYNNKYTQVYKLVFINK